MFRTAITRSSAPRVSPLLSVTLLSLLISAVPGRSLAVASPLLIPKASSAIAIDGRTSDWSPLGPTAVSHLTGVPSGSPFGAKVRLGWDDTNLYVAGEVSDQDITVADDLSRDFGGSDALRVYLRTGPADLGGSTRFGASDYVFIATPTSLFQKPLKTVYGYGGYEHLDLDLTRLKVAARPTESGYTLELAIPWHELNTEPKRGLALSLQIVAVNASKGAAKSFAMLYPIPAASLESPSAIAQPAVLD